MKAIALCFLILASVGELAKSATASMVWFEFMADGRYKVVVRYSVPEIKEVRQSYVIFEKKKDAEKYYWALVRGADFYSDKPDYIRYENVKSDPKPW